MTLPPLRVLVVEDSEDDTLLLVRELRGSGRDVVWERVETAEQMKAALTAKLWDLLVSDYSMPHFSAPKALELFRTMDLDLPFIVVSGTVGEDVAVETMKAGAHDFFLKGGFTRLVPAVKRELEQATERQARRKAEEARAQLAAIVESSNDAIIGRNLDGTVTAWNAAAERLYGYSAEEAIGRPITLHVPADRSDEIGWIIEKIRLGEIVEDFETIRLRKDGTRIDVSLTASPIRSSSGEVIGASAIARDISERKRTAESLQKLRHAVEHAANAIFTTDPEGAITYVNPAFEKIYGYTRKEALGKTPRILKSGRQDQAFYERFWQRVLAGESVRAEFINKTRDGKLVTVEATVSPVPDSEGARIGFLAVQNDITERKRIEENLRKSEGQFSLAFHASPIPTSISELETGRILDANDQFVRVLGYSREELIGRTTTELGIWVDPAEQHRIWSAMARKGATRAGEIRLRTRAAEIRDVVGSAVPIEVGSLSCVLSTFVDVTDRNRAQAESRKNEERFRRLVDSNTIGIAVGALSGRIFEANDAYLEMLGYTREEFLAGTLSWSELTPPEYRDRDLAAVEQLRRTGIAQPWEKEFLRKDGSRVPILIGVAMLGESEGSCIFYIVDLRPRRQAEETLRQSEQRYRLLFDDNPQPMWVFDEMSLRFLAVNDAASLHYGYSREEFLGMTIADIRPTEDVPALRRLLDTEPREPHDSGVWKHRKKDGTVIDVEVWSNPIDFGGRASQFVLARDVSDQRLLEQQLRQAQKMEAVGQLAGGVAHDFNNLLTAILGYSDLLETEVGKESPLLESIREIRKAGERAASLTRQLLAFSRKQVLEPKVLDLNALVQDLEKMLRRLIGEDIALDTALSPILGRVRADSGQVEQVIMNLSVNSRDAMPRGGKLTIETGNVDLDEGYASQHHAAVRPGRYVMLAVTDTGIGMSAETRARVFEPFFTTKERGKGTGLGLATVYGIVKQSEGYIWVYTEAGLGTTFKIYLPRVDEAAAVDAPRRPALSLEGSETILLVEDEGPVRALARRILQSFGYEVLEAASAAAALEITRRRASAIDLVLTDVIMPGMGGVDLVTQLRALRPGTRVLYMSGYTDDAVVRHGILDPAAAFIQKPFSREALARKVREVLGA